MAKKIKFEAYVRKQQTPFPDGLYGRITSKLLGAFIGKRVKITIEEIEQKA